MKKILFLHGFFASGSCAMAHALREAFEGSAVVLTPDLPLRPKEALDEIRTIIDRERPDLLIGNSCGAFLAQMLAPIVGIPALLGNPCFKMTEFLKVRLGEHQYKAPRRDGNQRLIVDEALIDEFAELETVQFDCCNPYYKERVWGLFGEQDTLALQQHLSFPRWPYAYRAGGENLVRPACHQDDDGVFGRGGEAFPAFQRGQIQARPFRVRLGDAGAHGGLSGSLWRSSLLGAPRKDVLREGNKRRKNF